MHEYVQGEVPYVEPERKKAAKRKVKVPPFAPGPVKSSAEVEGTKAAALRQADAIRAAWSRVGQEVNPEIHSEMRGGFRFYWVTTPGLVNGLPVKKES